jgi:hypothetical protein
MILNKGGQFLGDTEAGPVRFAGNVSFPGEEGGSSTSQGFQVRARSSLRCTSRVERVCARVCARVHVRALVTSRGLSTQRRSPTDLRIETTMLNANAKPLHSP